MNKLCQICSRIIPQERFDNHALAVTCDSTCAQARKKGISRNEALRLSIIKANWVDDAPWPQADHYRRLRRDQGITDFGCSPEGRAWEGLDR